MIKSDSWRTRFGFYLLALGSAFSLGNLWRFPFVVGENGGGAFVLLYVFLCLLLGLPLLIAELILGRSSRASILSATMKWGKGSKWVGRLCLLLSLVVLSYYSVVSGWVLHFMTRFVALWFQSDPSLLSPQALLENGVLQFLLSSVHLLAVIFVISRGVQDGLEKWINYFIPIFAGLVLLLVFKTMSLPSNWDVLRFLFYPDFSMLTLSSLNQAVAHVFFTLSVGFGTMVTFGSYMKSDEHIPTAGYRVTLVDALVSLVALLLVFPVAFQASGTALSDPVLLFEVIPRFLLELRWGPLFGFLFFLCLYFAALNASLGLFENLVANIQDLFKSADRRKASWIVGLVVLSLSVIPSILSVAKWAPEQQNLIELMDSIFINWMLPVIALAFCLSFSHWVPESIQHKNFVDSTKIVSQSMYSHWRFALKWVLPLVIGLGLILQIVGHLKIH